MSRRAHLLLRLIGLVVIVLAALLPRYASHRASAQSTQPVSAPIADR